MVRRHEPTTGVKMERGNLAVDVKGNLQVEEPTRKNTNAIARGGTVRSSVEASVMGVERRDWVIRLGPELGLRIKKKKPKTTIK